MLSWHAERVTISRFSILGVLAIVSCIDLPITWVPKWGRVDLTYYVNACPPAVNFADQLLSIATTLPQNYNIYGLGEHKTQLKLKYVFLKSDYWSWWEIFEVIPFICIGCSMVISMLLNASYHMAGNFCRVLIFAIFVVDLAVTKFSHPQKLMLTVIDESMIMGVATNIVAAWPTLPNISKQQ